MNKLQTEEDREASGWTLFVILLMIIVIWLASGWLLSSIPERGTFGDMFGAINALFSGSAFATLIYTVFLQRTELKIQRQELAETRKELQRSAAAQQASEVALRAQAEASAQSANLAAVNSLLTIYREAISESNRASNMLEPEVDSLRNRLEVRQARLLAILEETYQRITKEHAEREQAMENLSPGVQ